MSDALSTYSFLPWLRQGIANQIQSGSSTLRAEIPVQLTLKGEGISPTPLTAAINKSIQVYGPGDVVGIEPRAIVKVEPRHWITNFEPNYLPYIEFYDEDFPWRYTPAAPDLINHRLTPWIMLVVMTEAEFTEGKNIQNRPLSYVEIAQAATVLPRFDQLWAWAHVHVNQDLGAVGEAMTSTQTDAFLGKLQTALNANPDFGYSRILCPRKLAPNTAYHAFLMPVFESGRLAGLGQDPAKTPSVNAFSGANYGGRLESTAYPYYHRWHFQTGSQGDFEYLVRLLQPKPVDKSVGRRDMDVQRPGANLPGILNLDDILKLGGALRVPLESLKQEDQDALLSEENWSQPYPHPFQSALAAFINLTDDYTVQSALEAHQQLPVPPIVPVEGSPETETDADPLITPPLYGRWHALTQRLLTDRAGNPLPTRENWVHELNLDPRHRVTAGFGTDVVRTNQEDYMNAAWEQVGDVIEANRRIRWAQLAKEVSCIWYDRHMQPWRQVNLSSVLVFTAPLHRRVVEQGLTVHHQMQTSRVVPALVSTPMRRLLRSRGRIMKALPFAGAIQPGTLLDRVNAGEVSAASPKQTPTGIVTVNQVANGLSCPNIPPLPPAPPVPSILPEVWRINGRVIDANCRPFTQGKIQAFDRVNNQEFYLGEAGLGQDGQATIIYSKAQFQRGDNNRRGPDVIVKVIRYEGNQEIWRTDVIPQIGPEQPIDIAFLGAIADPIREENQTPSSVDQLPRSPDFEVLEPGTDRSPKPGNTDSPEATTFKEALKDSYLLIEASREVGTTPSRGSVNLPNFTTATFEGINPELTIPRRTASTIFWPGHIQAQFPQLSETFIEAMAYPELDLPMYKPLVNISSELFLPNINKIEQNSITLLETNQKFIEAYMVGLNHEFARELLWREYPTDQRGSYFRQFWDVSSFRNPANLNDEALKERLRDIPPLHLWSQTSKLGDHDHREAQGDKEEEVVLVIRGELLKKYPTAVIYAHKAEWTLKADGTIDRTKERRLVSLSDAEMADPPRNKVKTPLYQAQVAPDIYFFGFDLTALEARGGSGAEPGDQPGWFFVIKERPGEPRFGLDIEHSGPPNVWNLWNDLAWEDVQPGPAGSFLEINRSFPLVAPVPGADAEGPARLEQHNEDRDIRWDVNTNAADLAYILYQVPVLVAVHASEMLAAIDSLP